MPACDAVPRAWVCVSVNVGCRVGRAGRRGGLGVGANSGRCNQLVAPRSQALLAVLEQQQRLCDPAGAHARVDLSVVLAFARASLSGFVLCCSAS